MNGSAPSTASARLAIVLSHPTQYYSPWFRHLATNGDWTLRVFYLWDFGVTAQRDERFATTFAWDVDLLSGYDHEMVPNAAQEPGTHHFGGLDNPGLLTRLRQFAPQTVLMFGYKYRSHLRVVRFARRHGWKLMFRGDSHLIGHPPVGWMKRLMLRQVFRRFDAFLYVGAANRVYFEKFGVAESKLTFCPHAVDGARFEAARDSDLGRQARLHANLPLNAQIVLFSGKFHPEKAAGTLLDAFLALDRPDVHLVLAGDGEEREVLLQKAARHRDRVHFLPFANQSAMPARYALADLFVLPSEGLFETWGLAVNEAMHVGRPSLVSDRVGCQQDLVTPGVTGWVFPAGDRPALSARLGEALTTLKDHQKHAAIELAVRHRISQYSYAAAATGVRLAWQSITPASCK